MDEIYIVRRVATWEKVFFDNERDGLPQFRKISNAIWK